MKLHTGGNAVETQGVIASNQFTIKQSPKAFQILSSGLYSNKPMAIVRELSANAADAHVLNGNQKVPFDVKIPNKLDPQFYIRDYGPGLSEEGVMKLYTTYFESTKSNSNDFIGGLGLGSKSPFSYTDSFTVSAIHQGVKTVYSAFVNEDGMPQIVKLMDGTPTDEPSGLQIGFPVEPKDMRAFELEAQRILPWFNPTPNVLGASIKALEAPTDVIGPLSIYQNIPVWTNNYHREHTTFVKMGHVIYPVSWESAGLDDTKDPALTLIKDHSSSSIYVFDIPIGMLEVAASREGLQYDATTRKNIKDVFTKISSQLGEYLENKVSDYRKTYNRFEAMLRISALDSQLGFSLHEAGRVLKTKNLSLASDTEIKFPTTEYKYLQVSRLRANGKKSEPIVKGAIGSTPETIISSTQGPVFVEIDAPGAVATAKNYMSQKPKEDYISRYSRAYMFGPTSLRYANHPDYLKERDQFLAAMGSPPLKKSSDYKTARTLGATARNKVTKETCEGYQFVDKVLLTRYLSKSDIPRKVVDIKDIDYFVPSDMTSMSIIVDGASMSIASKGLIELFKAYQASGKTLPNIVAVPKTYISKVERLNVSPMEDWIKEALSDPGVQKELGTNKRFWNYEGHGWNDSSMAFARVCTANQKFFSGLGPGWKNFSTSTEYRGSTLQEVKDTFKSLLDKHKIVLSPVQLYDVKSMLSSFSSSYPMLMLTMEGLRSDSSIKSTLSKDIEHYVREKGIDLAAP